MGRKRIGLGDVGVVFFLGDTSEGHGFRFRPIFEIGGGGARNGAKATIAPFRPYAEVEHVAAFCRRPEGDILGIKDAGSEDGLVLKFGPMDAIGGGKAEEPVFVVTGDRLEFLAGVNVGVGVEKRGEVMGDLHLGVVLHENDIVVIAVLEGQQAEFGLHPISAVATFRVARERGGFDRTLAAVIHAEKIAVFDYDDVEAVGAFPLLIKGKGDRSGSGIDEFVGNPRQFINQVAIEERFTSCADVERS